MVEAVDEIKVFEACILLQCEPVNELGCSAWPEGLHWLH